MCKQSPGHGHSLGARTIHGATAVLWSTWRAEIAGTGRCATPVLTPGPNQEWPQPVRSRASQNPSLTSSAVGCGGSAGGWKDASAQNPDDAISRRRPKPPPLPLRRRRRRDREEAPPPSRYTVLPQSTAQATNDPLVRTSSRVCDPPGPSCLVFGGLPRNNVSGEGPGRPIRRHNLPGHVSLARRDRDRSTQGESTDDSL